MTRKKEKVARNVNIVFKEDDAYINQLKKYLNSDIKWLEKFYKTKNANIIIEFIYSRKEFEEKSGYKNSPEWLVGMAKNNKIIIASPLVIEKISSHKKSRVRKIIIHELSHIFNSKINKNILTWIDEGTAQFLANQKKKKDFTEKDWKFFVNNILNKQTKLSIFAKNKGYSISYWLIKRTVQRLGKNYLLKLIKINPNNHKDKDRIKMLIEK